MKKIHALSVAALLGLAAVLGVLGATRTAGLGAAAHAQAAAASSDALATRSQRLDAIARSIAKARADRPPALPPVPAAASTRPSVAPRIVYQRPAPVVVLQRSADHEDEHEDEWEGDDD